LLQQVRLRPVLPALKEIKITLISSLLRTASRACSRLSARMLPSSNKVIFVRVDESCRATGGPLTSDVFNTGLLQERLDDVQERRKLKERPSIRQSRRGPCPFAYLREYDRLLFAIRTVGNLPQDLHSHPRLGAARRYVGTGIGSFSYFPYKILTVVAGIYGEVGQPVQVAKISLVHGRTGDEKAYGARQISHFTVFLPRPTSCNKSASSSASPSRSPSVAGLLSIAAASVANDAVTKEG
jgi:hypothetical protein